MGAAGWRKGPVELNRVVHLLDTYQIGDLMRAPRVPPALGHPRLRRLVVRSQRTPEGQGTDASLEPDGPGLLVVRDGLVLFGATSLSLGLSSLNGSVSRLLPDGTPTGLEISTSSREMKPPRSGLVQRYADEPRPLWRRSRSACSARAPPARPPTRASLRHDGSFGGS